jgi:hypothetical protein
MGEQPNPWERVIYNIVAAHGYFGLQYSAFNHPHYTSLIKKIRIFKVFSL